MAKPYPKEFRDDVVRVARNREPGVELSQIAKDFGVHFTTLYSWMRKADIEDGHRPGTTAVQSAELREAKRRIKTLEQEVEGLRRAGCGLLLAGSSAGKMSYPLVRDLAAAGIPVAVTCRVLKIARQPYYRWLANPVTDAERDQAYRANALFDAHRDDPEFGYRHLLDEARDAGQAMAARTAWRICSDNSWWSAFGKKRRKNGKKPGPPVHDDLCAVTDKEGRIRHEFNAAAAIELWIGDITEHWTGEGKLYVRALGHHEMVGSMGRVGAAGDNAAMESFFSLLQKNVLNRRTWATREDLRIANRYLDRKDLPPTPQARHPRPIDPDRVRDHHDHASHSGCVTNHCHQFVQQTP